MTWDIDRLQEGDVISGNLAPHGRILVGIKGSGRKVFISSDGKRISRGTMEHLLKYRQPLSVTRNGLIHKVDQNA